MFLYALLHPFGLFVPFDRLILYDPFDQWVLFGRFVPFDRLILYDPFDQWVLFGRFVPFDRLILYDQLALYDQYDQ